MRRCILNVTLPDGNVLEMDNGSSTLDVAEKIGSRLAKATIAGKVCVNGDTLILDANTPLPGDCQLWILTADDENRESLHVLRHSTAHVMAEAICSIYPDAKLVYGPSLEDGFYYDIDLKHRLSPDDFVTIEEKMKAIVKENRSFTRCDMSRDEAMKKLQEEDNRYKVENAERAEGDTISFYYTGEPGNGTFEDLCRGPHLPSTGKIGAFAIKQVSGSYYRGDVNEKQLQRVYGTAFFKAKALKTYMQQLEEAKKRDHRVIGKELDLFSISPEVGSGLVLWHPKGSIVRMALEGFLKAEMVARGYLPVYAPNIGRLDLYRTSGHYPYYRDSQFPPLYETDRGRTLLSLMQLVERAVNHSDTERDKMISHAKKLAAAAQETWGTIPGLSDAESPEKMIEILDAELASEEGYLLKPMNCPHHLHIYKANPRSYRDLPLRYFEFGTVYRNEQSGELSGMVRVRGFTQDDAHLFCTPEQLPEEIMNTIDLTLGVLRAVDLKDFRVRIGLRDPDSDKYVGDEEHWNMAEEHIRKAVKAAGLEATEEIGEAAFYGPKIDFVVKDAIGREWQLGTVQVDYNLPERFDLTYVGADNQSHRPIMIHRAPFGSMERFIGILIEHFAGAFPLWLAPLQVAVVTISDKSREYAEQVFLKLAQVGLRAQIDNSSDKIGPKKHKYRQQKVPYILVVGEQESAEGTVNINDCNGRVIGTYPLEKFIEGCQHEIFTKGHKDEKGPWHREKDE